MLDAWEINDINQRIISQMYHLIEVCQQEVFAVRLAASANIELPDLSAQCERMRAAAAAACDAARIKYSYEAAIQ